MQTLVSELTDTSPIYFLAIAAPTISATILTFARMVGKGWHQFTGDWFANGFVSRFCISRNVEINSVPRPTRLRGDDRFLDPTHEQTRVYVHGEIA